MAKARKNIHVVIVGGGFAGVKAALLLDDKPGITMTFISDTNNFEYHGALYRSATGHSPLEVVIPLRDIFRNVHNIDVVRDSVVGIDPKKKRIACESGEVYNYDIAILAMGNVVNYFGIKGMEEHAMSMNTITHTIALRQQLIQTFKDPKITNPCVAVVGGGPSGLELSGEVQHFADMVTRKYGLPKKHVKVEIIEGADRVLPTFHPELSKKAAARLKKLGVKLRLNTRVNSCEANKVCIAGGDIVADVIVWTAGSRPVDFYEKHPKVFKLDKGRVKVDPFLRAAGQHDIFVLGDNAATPFSGMAQTALHDAKFVARNILRTMKNKKPTTYRVWHPIYVVPIGKRWAIMQSPEHMISGYRGWLVRRQADLWIFKNFEPYKRAVKIWRKGNRLADF